MVAERATRAFWPFWTVLFAILAQLTVVEVMNWLIQAFKDAINAMVHDSYAPLSALLVDARRAVEGAAAPGPD